MWRAVLAACLVAGLLVSAAWGQGVLRNKSVVEHLAAGDCRRAGEKLALDLVQPTGPVLLLAGWLSQWGRCLERSADKAWTFYERAHAAGEASAALRLAGLAATPEGGADVVAVLWWARRDIKQTIRLDDCDPFPGRADVADTGFVEALKAWPQRKLIQCRDKIGFLSLLSVETYYPLEASRFDIEAQARLDYDLHTGQQKVTPLSGSRSEAFVRRIEAVAKQAMQALPRSAEPLSGSVDFIFKIE